MTQFTPRKSVLNGRHPTAKPSEDRQVSIDVHLSLSTGASSTTKSRHTISEPFARVPNRFAFQTVSENPTIEIAMVVVPLKSQFVSLIITLVSLVSERFVFGSCTRLIRYLETQRLYEGQQIRIRWHVRRTRLVAILSAMFFLTLELFVSFYTDPARVTEREMFSCVSLDTVRNLRDAAFERPLSRNVKNQCSFVENGVFHQRGGNVTEAENQFLVECAEEDIFSFELSELVAERTFPSIKPVMRCSNCSNIGDGARCLEWCAFTVRQNDSVFYSFGVEPEEALALDTSGEAQKVLSYLGTTVHFNAEDLLGVIAQRVADAYTDGITDPTSQRRRIFMGSREGTCEFSMDRGEGTNVPVALIAAVSSIWVASLVFKLLTFFARKENIFDVSNPFHWAFRVSQKDDVVIKDNPVIRWETMNEDRPFLLSQAVSETSL
ncbi:hypothetical protein FGB62_31g17 [Gracilaria domingensis]|nr:hypothetical protein FGB62_31g17 [Gracilaria domingensis]